MTTGTETTGTETTLLADHTTLRVGGPAARLQTVGDEAALVDAVRAADADGKPLLVVAGGSNLLVSDDGFAGTVLRVASRGVEVVSGDACGGVEIRVAAGEPWDDVVARAVAEGWIGVEALAGIPGSTGATPVQNVGAYGQEVAQTITAVRVWDRGEQRLRTLFNRDCEFGYRSSLMKRHQQDHRGGVRFVVLDVTFQLRPGTLAAPVRYGELARSLGLRDGRRAPLGQVREAVLALRRGKGMVLDPTDHDTWSAGSFFTNPVLPEVAAAALPPEAPRWPADGGRVKTSAAWLIEQAGFHRGYGLPGPASLSTKHTLALTNRGNARAEDLLALARTVRDGVQQRFGVRLVPEPVLVGCSL